MDGRNLETQRYCKCRHVDCVRAWHSVSFVIAAVLLHVPLPVALSGQPIEFMTGAGGSAGEAEQRSCWHEHFAPVWSR